MEILLTNAVSVSCDLASSALQKQLSSQLARGAEPKHCSNQLFGKETKPPGIFAAQRG
jgi:hypothetical protein